MTFAEPLSGKQCAQLLAAVTEARIDEYWSLRASALQLANDAGESGLTVLQAASFCSYPKSSALADDFDDHSPLFLTLVSSRRTGEVIYGCTQSSPTPNMAPP